MSNHFKVCCWKNRNINRNQSSSLAKLVHAVEENTPNTSQNTTAYGIGIDDIWINCIQYFFSPEVASPGVVKPLQAQNQLMDIFADSGSGANILNMNTLKQFGLHPEPFKTPCI